MMISANAPQRITLVDFKTELRKFPRDAFRETETLHQFLTQYAVEPATLEPHLRWDSQHYTRNLIDKTALYELLAICWDIGQQSSIHNHHQQNCWMAAVIGRLQVQNYRTIFEDIRAGKCKIEKTDCVEMNLNHPAVVNPAEPVHKVFNPREFQQRAVSLHVYSLPYNRCVVYSEEQGTCGEIELSYTTGPESRG